MRRLFWLALIAAIAWFFLNRGKTPTTEGATIGYADGSSITLDPGSPELDRLLQVAAEARAR